MFVCFRVLRKCIKAQVSLRSGNETPLHLPPMSFQAKRKMHFHQITKTLAIASRSGVDSYKTFACAKNTLMNARVVKTDFEEIIGAEQINSE